MKLCNCSGSQNRRRIGALERLQVQLKDAETKWNSLTKEEQISSSLLRQSIVRMKKEVSILQSRIVPQEVARATRTYDKKSNTRTKAQRNRR